MKVNEKALELAGLKKENIAGIDPNSARQVGSQQIDATVIFMGNQLQISTRAGVTTIILTPQQQTQLTSEFNHLR
jgi:hypothetical protein